MAELAVIDEVNANILLPADCIGNGRFEFVVESRLVDFLGGHLFVIELDQFLRARQTPDMRRQNPIGHGYSSPYIFFAASFAPRAWSVQRLQLRCYSKERVVSKAYEVWQKRPRDVGLFAAIKVKISTCCKHMWRIRWL